MQMINMFLKKTVATLVMTAMILTYSAVVLNECITFASVGEYGVQNQSNSNIVFDSCFFIGEESKGYVTTANLDEENLSIKLNIEVKDSGYLKNASISLSSESKLNFEIGDVEENDLIESISTDTVRLNQINHDDNLELTLPIKYLQTDEATNLSSDIVVTLNGVYVDNSGDKSNISDKINMNLSWLSNSEITTRSELTKFVKYETSDLKGLIAQTQVTIGLNKENLPISKTEISIDALNISGLSIKDLSVISNEIEDFSPDNWSYDSENGKINISVSGQELSNDTETYVITYVYEGDIDVDYPLTLESNIISKIYLEGTSEEISGEFNAVYEIKKEVGDIVTYSQEVLSPELNKGNILANTYSENNSYDTEYSYKYIINVAETTLLDKIVLKDIKEVATCDDAEYTLEDTSYYSMIKVSETDFINILGEDGYIDVYDKSNKKIETINSSLETSEDGYYLLDISSENISKVILKTSKPVGTGNLEIIETKNIVDTDYTKSEIKSFETIENKTTASIYYEGDVASDIGTKSSDITLTDTITDATISIDKTALSTIVENENVEMKIELNNADLGTDFYKNPTFQITLPEEIKEITLNKVSVINADNAFDIDSVNANYVDGNIVITVKLNGTQTEYSLNTITNGTNILLDLDITVDVYTSNKEEEIVLAYVNEDATSYNEGTSSYGVSKATIEYTAPTGVVSVNTLSGYDDNNSKITSVEQGTVTDKIEIYSESRVATNDILVMNNNENVVTDVKILGRIPFEGNTSIETGEDLGTTLMAPLAGYIIANSENKVDATIYYSVNGTATADLSDESNGWKTTVGDLSTIKSYLIVLEEGYQMDVGEVVNFSYDYVIPENLSHNENIYGAVATYYTNITEVATNSEISAADMVGLSTGKGPELSLTTSLAMDNAEASEYEYIKYSVVIKNIGEEDAENVVVNAPVPTRSTFASFKAITTTEAQGGWSLTSESSKKYNVGTLKSGEEATYSFYVQVNKLPTIEEYYASYEGFTKNSDGTYSLYEEVEDEDGETTYKETKITSLPDIYSEFTATVSAKDLAKDLESNTTKLKINKANIVTAETVKTEAEIVNVNEEMTYEISVKNTSEEDMTSVKIEKTLPSEISYVEAYVVGYEDDGVTTKKIDTVSYDSSSRKVVWTVDSLASGRTLHVKLVVKANELPQDTYQVEVSTSSKVKANGEEYETGEISVTVAKPKLVISQEADVTNTYVTVGQIINYTFTIKNEGLVKAQSVSLVDNLPSKVKITGLTYVSDGIEMTKVVSNNEDATVYSSIQPNSELIVKVQAVTLSIDKASETISNYAVVDADNIDSSEKTNIITHVIESSSSSSSDDEEDNNTVSSVKKTSNSTSSNYKITGSAWLDTDKNGKYTTQDKMISNLEVMLVNATTGKEIARTVTLSTGMYTFSGLSAGKYYVGFYYNSKKYGLTEYKKTGVAENVNSDAYASEIDGTIVGLTDTITISSTSISNIDIGLVDATVFDLSLSKVVSKITVQNSNGTTKTSFNSDIAKIDIPAKYLSSSKVYIEYKITVKNEGEIEGYAKQIVDYKDSDLTFSQDLNPDWYEGSDGNLYTDALSNTVIAIGKTAEITLILTKQMTEENTGVINNTAEISKAYNAAGVSDKDSTPGNKVQTEDDYASSDVIISVKTGETLIYTSAIIVMAIVCMIIIYILHRNKRRIKRVLKSRKVVD